MPINRGPIAAMKEEFERGTFMGKPDRFTKALIRSIPKVFKQRNLGPDNQAQSHLPHKYRSGDHLRGCKHEDDGITNMRIDSTETFDTILLRFVTVCSVTIRGKYIEQTSKVFTMDTSDRVDGIFNWVHATLEPSENAETEILTE
jgi:hypothetical protein